MGFCDPCFRHWKRRKERRNSLVRILKRRMLGRRHRRFMNVDFAAEKVNPEQTAAIAAVDGPSLVIAGPGSGKTRTLTVKAKYIRRLYPDARILCVTHTRKAADEMRARIGRHENSRAIQVSTIHSLCYRILKTNLGQSIRILSDYDHGIITRLAAHAAGID